MKILQALQQEMNGNKDILLAVAFKIKMQSLLNDYFNQIEVKINKIMKLK